MLVNDFGATVLGPRLYRCVERLDCWLDEIGNMQACLGRLVRKRHLVQMSLVELDVS